MHRQSETSTPIALDLQLKGPVSFKQNNLVVVQSSRSSEDGEPKPQDKVPVSTPFEKLMSENESLKRTLEEKDTLHQQELYEVYKEVQAVNDAEINRIRKSTSHIIESLRKEVATLKRKAAEESSKQTPDPAFLTDDGLQSLLTAERNKTQKLEKQVNELDKVARRACESLKKHEENTKRLDTINQELNCQLQELRAKR